MPSDPLAPRRQARLKEFAALNSTAMTRSPSVPSLFWRQVAFLKCLVAFLTTFFLQVFAVCSNLGQRCDKTTLISIEIVGLASFAVAAIAVSIGVAGWLRVTDIEVAW